MMRLHAKFGVSSINNQGVRAKLRFMRLAAAAVERMRICENETCSGHPGHETVLMVLELCLCDLPFPRKPEQNNNDASDNGIGGVLRQE